MDFNILEKKENLLIERKEIRFEVSYAGVTPSFEDVRKELVKKLKSDEKLTVLDAVHQQYGAHKAKGYAKVYDNEAAMKVELKHKLAKNFEPKKKEGAGQEVVAKEAPKPDAAKPSKPEAAKPVAEKPEKPSKPEAAKPAAEKSAKPSKPEAAKPQAEKPAKPKAEKDKKEG